MEGVIRTGGRGRAGENVRTERESINRLKELKALPECNWSCQCAVYIDRYHCLYLPVLAIPPSGHCLTAVAIDVSWHS